MSSYEDKGPNDVTAMFRIAYDVAVGRCDLCPRCGKAPVSKVLHIRDPVKRARSTCSRSATPAMTRVNHALSKPMASPMTLANMRKTATMPSQRRLRRLAAIKPTSTSMRCRRT